MKKFMKRHTINNMEQENNVLESVKAQIVDTHKVINIETGVTCFIGTYEECDEYKHSSVYSMLYEIFSNYK